jgi:nucleotide-binding universal stress UspA family protein
MKVKPSSKPEHVVHPDAVAEDPSAPRSGSCSRALPGFKHILVAIDFSESGFNALDYASVLAQKFHSEVTLLHVVEPTVYSPNSLLGSSTMDEAGETLLAGARERLKKFKQRAAAQGLVADALVRMGRAQSDISDTAKAIGADLIVMGTHGHSGARQSTLGGTAERVLRYSGCPVLAVPQP